jgi:DNA-binding NarL/FixJ family response regulator
VAARPFVERTAPMLDFTPSQKRLLAAALRGAETTELADALCHTPAAIKRTWTAIFEKFVRHCPALLPTSEGSLRGQQKRHKVTAYIRAHPEEMRPFPPQRVG